MAILHRWSDLVAIGADGSTVKKEIAGAAARLTQVEIRAGTKADRHSHPHEQFVQVIAGCGTLETEEGRQSFSAGSVFHFPAGTWHAAVFDEDTILVETNLKAS